MTKEMAIQLLKGKDVYLTSEGKKLLLEVLNQATKEVVLIETK